jgi:hypothetical protein
MSPRSTRQRVTRRKVSDPRVSPDDYQSPHQRSPRPRVSRHAHRSPTDAWRSASGPLGAAAKKLAHAAAGNTVCNSGQTMTSPRRCSTARRSGPVADQTVKISAAKCGGVAHGHTASGPQPQVLDPQQVIDFIAALKLRTAKWTVPIRVICFDTLNTGLVGGSENESKDIALLLNADARMHLRQFRAATAAWIVHIAGALLQPLTPIFAPGFSRCRRPGLPRMEQ